MESDSRRNEDKDHHYHLSSPERQPPDDEDDDGFPPTEQQRRQRQSIATTYAADSDAAADGASSSLTWKEEEEEDAPPARGGNDIMDDDDDDHHHLHHNNAAVAAVAAVVLAGRGAALQTQHQQSPPTTEQQHLDDGGGAAERRYQDDDDEDSSSSSRNDDSGSVGILNALDDSNDEEEGGRIMDEEERDAIALLKQIFPSSTPSNELLELHRNRCQQIITEQSTSTMRNNNKKGTNNNATLLDDDFLRILPPETAILRQQENGNTFSWQYRYIDKLQQQVIQQFQSQSIHHHRHEDGISSFEYLTKVIFRKTVTAAGASGGGGGLGMTLVQDDGGSSMNGGDGQQQVVVVHAISEQSLAWQHDIRVDDVLMGVEGVAFTSVPDAAASHEAQRSLFLAEEQPLSSNNKNKNNSSVVQQAVTSIQMADDPLVLHLQRPLRRDDRDHHDDTLPAASMMTTTPQQQQPTTPSLLDTSDLLSSSADEGDASFFLQQESAAATSSSTPTRRRNDNDNISSSSATIHPFVRLLGEHGIIMSKNQNTTTTANSSLLEQQRYESQLLYRMEVRAQQWEESSSLFDCYGDNENDDIVLIPLAGIRPALSVRIVNTFTTDENCYNDNDSASETTTAYTVWVYDVASGTEWYAPVRYFHDWEDLYRAVQPLCPDGADLPFPKNHRGTSASSYTRLLLFPGRRRLKNRQPVETNIQRETKCRQLERFLRYLCSMIYKQRHLHPYMAEVAIHVQSFLGCEERVFLQQQQQQGDVSHDSSTATDDDDDDEQTRVRLLLKRSLQRYTYRLFLLDSLSKAVDSFVDFVRTRGPRLQDLEEYEASDTLQSRATEDLLQIQSFLDRIQEMILEGCMDDFKAIAERSEYQAIHPLIYNRTMGGSISGVGGDAAGYWDRLVREAVREQVEIEVYVPLRSIVSRWLVHGWRHEDMEIQFKIKELRKRPPEFFRIPSDVDWSPVSIILNEGVGLSTLPCVKLRAIVDAAREIFRIYSRRQTKAKLLTAAEESALTTEHKTPDGQHQLDVASKNHQHLGADDFLPIFIYCVVQADMERPCALCVLLRTLCDRINKIGEIGYYVLTFEAAITHCQEIDLTEDREHMQSFLSVPLDDS